MSIHKRPVKNGYRYDVKIRRPDGTQYQNSFKTKKEAERFEAQEKARLIQGTWLDNRNNTITFAMYAHKWLKSNKSKRPKTLLRDKGIVNRHLIPALGEMPIKNIKSSDLRQMVSQWSDQGLSAGTIRRHKAILSAIFNMALDDDLIHKSPVHRLTVPRIEKSEGWALTSEEAQRLLASIDQNYYSLIYIMVTTGIRWSEAAGLQIQHLDLLSPHPRLKIERTLHETPKGLVAEATKSSASKRNIILTQQQVNVIAQHITETGRTGANQDEPLFTSPRGHELAYQNFRSRIWVPAITKANLQGLKIHDLRKTAATNLVQAGIDIKSVTEMLGHEDIRTTLQHYAKTSPEGLLAASEALVEALKISSTIHEEIPA
jgi:site-specific recombinase XerD